MRGERAARRQAMRANAPGPVGTRGARSVGAALFGAVAVGAAAIGALASGRLAIGQLRVRRAHSDELSIGTLKVERLIIVQKEQP